MVANWILEENLKPLLETVSEFVDYKFDEWDWAAVSTSIINTNDETDEWYEYQLIGEQTVHIKIANDPGSGVVHVQMQSASDIEGKIGVAIGIFQKYSVT
jgi:hypothetical protein